MESQNPTLTVTITGSGTPLPSPGTAGPGVLVRTGEHVLQFDAGRGTVERLTDAGVALRSVSTVFVTHHHSDHLVGLADLVMTRWTMDHGTHEPLEIVAPAGPVIGFLNQMLEPWKADIDIRMEHTGRTDRPDPVIVAFDPATSPGEVWASGDVRVLAVAVHHEPVLPAVAFRIESPAGAAVISGDTRVCDEIADLAVDADVVVHEACRADALRAMFGDTPHVNHVVDYHADTTMLGAMAQRAEIPHLVLTHLIPPPSSDEQRQQFCDDVRSGGYTGEVTVAQDLTTITISP